MSKSVIVVSGTPGVGKSAVSEKLANILGYKYINLSKLAIEKNLLSHYDDERNTYVIDEYGLINEVLRITSEFNKLVIDTHYPEILPSELVDFVIVLRINPTILEKRLRERNWNARKIYENVLAEILSVITINAIEKFGENKVFEIDVTNKSIDTIVNEIIDIVRNREKYKPGQLIDWLTILSPDEITRYEY